MKKNSIIVLLSRYLFLILVTISLPIAYRFLAFITKYTVFYILSIVDSTIIFVSSNIFIYKSVQFAIIPACVAGAAYFLLTILNFTTPMQLKTRAKSLAFLLISFFVLNVTRILIFANVGVYGYEFFDAAHLFFWYFGSTVLVIALWFVNIRLFKINQIPFFTDVKTIIRETKFN